MATIYVVFDFETSGINPLTNRILEIGALHINMQTLEVLGSFQTVAGIPQVALDALNMHDAVLNMHNENGLFAEVVAKEPEGAFELDLKLAEWFKLIGAGPRDIVLCGNSIHFDRGFMECWMIQSFKFLSHRVVDTSSILSCHKEWAGDDKRHTAAHRSIADCEASLEVLRWAKSLWLKGVAVQKFEAMLPDLAGHPAFKSLLEATREITDEEFVFQGNVEDPQALVAEGDAGVGPAPFAAVEGATPGSVTTNTVTIHGGNNQAAAGGSVTGTMLVDFAAVFPTKESESQP